MEFGVLGPLEVHDGGRALLLGGAKQRALLTVLLLNANQVLPTSRLVELLWGEEAPETAAHGLQVYVSQLRKLLEPNRAAGHYEVLVSSASGYAIKIADDQLDTRRFERLVGEAGRLLQARDLVAAVDLLREALNLWRGQPLSDVLNEPFALAEVARLTELRLGALERRIDAELALGRHADLIAELEALIAEHPLRERLCAQLILALYRSGRQAEASDLYYRTRRRLVDELGMEPGPALQKLLKDVLRQDVSLDLAPERLAAPPRSHNLPLQLTSFVGRGRDLDEIKRLLARARLLTLVGPGGVGKTRLALQVASGVLDLYRDGVWLVDLASLSDPDLIPQAVSSALGLREQPGRAPTETLANFLQSRHLLLVLDNCEHLVEAAAGLAESVLRGSPQVRVLATSQERLNIPGEHVWHVQPLLTPDSKRMPPFKELVRFEALQLFTDRAVMVEPSFALTPQNAGAMAQICQRVDGVPLAIELAAAHSNAFAPEQLLARLGGRFKVLASGMRTALPRQKTLLATVEWSHNLLEEHEKLLFRRLSVFAGGWDLEAAEAVLSDERMPSVEVPVLLSTLVDKSLVVAEEGAFGRRYRLLETLREFAREQLANSGEASALRRRHALFFLELAGDAEAMLRGREAKRWLARLDQEHDNARAALAWSEEADNELQMRLAAAWTAYWRVQGHVSEGRRRLAAALSGAATPSPARMQCLIQASRLAYFQGDLGFMAPLGEALQIARQHNDLPAQAQVLNSMAVGEAEEGHLLEASRRFEESLGLWQRLGDNRRIAAARTNIALCDHYLGNPAAAVAGCEQALAILPSEDRRGGLMTLQALAGAEMDLERFEAAEQHLVQGLDIARELQDPVLTSHALRMIASLAASRQLPERALRLVAAAEVHLAERGSEKFAPLSRKSLEAKLVEMRALLGLEASDVAWREGRSMSLEDAINYALAPPERSARKQNTEEPVSAG
jgi:predicted ATPase/DNA-binding SARP family transcriptional activator